MQKDNCVLRLVFTTFIFLLTLSKGKWKKRKDDYDEYNDDDSIDSNEADGIPDAAKNDVEKQDEGAIEDEFGAKDYRSQMILKPDCSSRPLWVVRICPKFVARGFILQNCKFQNNTYLYLP